MSAAQKADALGFAIMEHLGPAALTGGKMRVYDAFVLGWNAALKTKVAQEVEPVAWLYESGTIGGYDYLLTRTREVEGNYAESAMWIETPLFTAPQAVNAWQPIETAPKDGSVFLITDGHHVYAGFRRPQDATWPWGIFDDTDPQPAGCCDGEDVDRVPFNSLRSERPTHWMPLPGAPA